jgi:hypothetical protein
MGIEVAGGPDFGAEWAAQRLLVADSSSSPQLQRSGEFSVPREVLDALKEVFGESVESVRVFENSRFARLHGDVLATTRRDRIYLTIGGNEFIANRELVLHEYFHVIRQWNTGDLTIMRYVIESIRSGYWNNRFEVEAREFARDNFEAFNRLLVP